MNRLSALMMCLALVVTTMMASRPAAAIQSSASVKDQDVAESQRRRQSSERCALIVPGFAAGDTCVTYEAVNNAVVDAQRTLRLAPPQAKTMTDIDVDNLALTLVEASRTLAIQYGLPRDAVYAGLPLIDTRKTIIDRFCPAYLKRPTCNVKRYREYNGMCNNLDNPQWGATLTSFRRLLPPAFADGISAPRAAASGAELPSPRFISAYNHRDLGFHDHAVTVFLPTWGQFIDHDMTLGGESKDPETDSEPKCCDVDAGRRHPACWPVQVPANDPFYSTYRRRCLEFVRSAGGLRDGCRLGPRITLNTITHVLDANMVYGASKETADKLRTFRGGLLRSNVQLRGRGLKDLLPPKLDSPDAGCARPDKDTYCFLAGDTRVNQQMMLVAMHTIMMREHNRIAAYLGRINTHWSDEKIYQETRHIVAAMVQHVTYNEFLPMVLGKDMMLRYGLLLNRDGYSSTYNPKADPTLPVSFFAAAFRFGHSLLPSAIERWSVNHQFIGARRLSDMLLRPFDVYQAGTCDQYLTGFMNQVSQAVDDSMTGELTNHLFQEAGNNWGSDLASLNMQRGRDHGVPGYNAFREYCGLNRARTWDDLSAAFTNDTLRRYSELYESPDDIDLWSAGISERPIPGSMVGPVFACIMGDTFRNLRQGDRFWYENGGWPSSFSPEQLHEIRKVKLSRIICDNSDNLDSAQVYVMVLSDPEINPRVKCKSSVLPRINLDLWRDTGNNGPLSEPFDDVTPTFDDFRPTPQHLGPQHPPQQHPPQQHPPPHHPPQQHPPPQHSEEEHLFPEPGPGADLFSMPENYFDDAPSGLPPIPAGIWEPPFHGGDDGRPAERPVHHQQKRPPPGHFRPNGAAFDADPEPEPEPHHPPSDFRRPAGRRPPPPPRSKSKSKNRGLFGRSVRQLATPFNL